MDLAQPIDISIPYVHQGGVRAFNAPTYQSQPLIAGDFIGDIDKGSPVNFYNIFINPHGNGAHTESVLHVDKRGAPINETLTTFHFLALLITADPIQKGEDKVIETLDLERYKIEEQDISALIIRTTPNDDVKLNDDYSNSNPPFLSDRAVTEINNSKVDHLLIDLPSVDREQDGGQLSAHKKFWNCEKDLWRHKTITELIYVDNDVKDGIYLLNLQTIPVDIDASPSRPVLYKVSKIGNI